MSRCRGATPAHSYLGDHLVGCARSDWDARPSTSPQHGEPGPHSNSPLARNKPHVKNEFGFFTSATGCVVSTVALSRLVRAREYRAPQSCAAARRGANVRSYSAIRYGRTHARYGTQT